MTDPELVAALAEEVRKALEAQEAKHATVVLELREQIGELREALRAVPAGKDGMDGKDGTAGRDGTDGANGKDGKDGDPGKDGRDGRDGKDGVASLDEIKAIAERTVTDLGIDGLVERAAAAAVGALPVMIYRGVFTEGATYPAGSLTTWAGSLWHANQATSEKPGDGSDAWTLAAKRGRDGKDAR